VLKQLGDIYLVHKLAEVFKCLCDILVNSLIALLKTALNARDSSSILLLLSIDRRVKALIITIELHKLRCSTGFLFNS